MNLKSFFREDLNLMNRWWHRLFFVIFIIAFISTVVAVISSMVNDNQLPKYRKVGMLSDRMTNNVQLIGNLVKPNEKIAVYEHNLYGSYLGNNFYDGNGGWLLNQQYYCAKNLPEKIEEVATKTGVSHYKGNTDLISASDFKNYLITTNAQCIEVLDLISPAVSPSNPFADLIPSDSQNRWGNVKQALSWGLEADDMAVWQMSVLKTIFAVLLPVLFTTIGFALLLVVYYKVFLFIVFGKSQITR
jgi:hypothetical protein